MYIKFSTCLRKRLYIVMLAGMVFAVLGMNSAPAVHAQEDGAEIPTETVIPTEESPTLLPSEVSTETPELTATETAIPTEQIATHMPTETSTESPEPTEMVSQFETPTDTSSVVSLVIEATGLKAPFPGGVTRSVTGTHDRAGGRHAIDFGMYLEDVVAMKAGTIVRTSWEANGGGNMLFMDNGDFCTAYLHLNKYYVTSGYVPQGTRIAQSGNTDGSSYHLHVAAYIKRNSWCGYSHSDEIPMIFDENGRELVYGDSLTSGQGQTRIPFGNNAYSRLFFDQGTERINLDVCADNLAGQTVYVKFWREGRSWDYSYIAQGTCVTFWDMDGAGPVFTDRPYWASVSIGGWPDTTWPVGCLFSTNRIGMCTQAQYPNESRDPAGTGLDCGQVSYNGVILYENVICDRDANGITKAFSAPTDWANIVSDFNDITSSIFVAPGWSVKVFEHSVEQGGGSWRCITGSMWDLRIDHYTNGNTALIINDTISSVQVFNNNNCTPESVSVLSVFTTDQNGTASALGVQSPVLAGDVLAAAVKSDFNAGNGIQLFMEVNNQFGTDQTAYFEWAVFDPAGQHVPELEWSGNLSTPPGDIYWLLPTTIPPDSLTGDYTFTGSITYNGSTTSASTTFHVNALTYTITGNAGESGVTLRYTDGTAKSITSASNGRYTITVPYNWSGSITPSKTGLTFSPTSKSYSHLTANQASQNYSAVLTIPSTGSYDGYILESTETSNIGGSVNATNTYFVLGDASADRQYRAILAFNTASLPDTATIQSVVVKIKQYGSPVGTNPFSILGSLYTDIRKGYFGTSVSLQTTDFNAAASTTSVAATFGKTPVSGWYSATLTSTGRSYVNKTSWTELRLRFSKDDNDDNGADYMKFYSGNYSSSSYRPQLIITYTLP